MIREKETWKDRITDKIKLTEINKMCVWRGASVLHKQKREIIVFFYTNVPMNGSMTFMTAAVAQFVFV